MIFFEDIDVKNVLSVLIFFLMYLRVFDIGIEKVKYIIYIKLF